MRTNSFIRHQITQKVASKVREEAEEIRISGAPSRNFVLALRALTAEVLDELSRDLCSLSSTELREKYAPFLTSEGFNPLADVFPGSELDLGELISKGF